MANLTYTTAIDWLLAGWNTIRMPGKSHRGPLPPADDELAQRAADLHSHVTQLAEEIGERLGLLELDRAAEHGAQSARRKPEQICAFEIDAAAGDPHL